MTMADTNTSSMPGGISEAMIELPEKQSPNGAETFFAAAESMTSTSVSSDKDNYMRKTNFLRQLGFSRECKTLAC